MKWMFACFLVIITSCIPINPQNPNPTQVALLTSSGTSYYFSSSIGDDTRTAIQAQNPGTPWKTISKLNSVFSILNPGDSVLLKRGDTFTGTILVSKSGSPTAPITIGAYGDGKKPILSGFQTLSGWKKVTKNNWESSEIAWNTTPRVFIIDGIVTPIGREPNNSYFHYQSHTSSPKTITSSSVASSTLNWSNAEVVIRKNGWDLSRNTITSHSGNTLTYTPQASFDWELIDGYGFFIQNHIKTLDISGEWFADSNTKKVSLYSQIDPSKYKIEISTTDKLIDFEWEVSHVTIENLYLKGANVYAVSAENSGHNIIIRNNDIHYSGETGIMIEAKNVIIDSNSVTDSNGTAIQLNNGSNSFIINNRIDRSSMTPGAATSNSSAIGGSGGLTIECNVITNSGYNGIYASPPFKINRNFISDFCINTGDGGGIYTDGPSSTTSIISENIVLTGKGGDREALGGEAYKNYSNDTNGIYLDDRSSNFIVKNNTTAHSGYGIYLHNSHEVELSNNLSYNNDYQIRFQHDYIAPNDFVRNVKMSHNTFISKKSTQIVLESASQDDDAHLLFSPNGFSQYNIYARPLDDNAIFRIAPRWSATGINLSQWQSYTSFQDTTSSRSGINIVPYKVNFSLGSNKTINGCFDIDINGIASWNNFNNITLSKDTTKFGDGALQVKFNSMVPTEGTYVTIPVSKITAEKNYQLKLSLQSVKPLKNNLSFYLRKMDSPYSILSNTVVYRVIANTRNDVTLLLTTSSSETYNPVLVLDINPADSTNNTIWFDNITLTEVDITFTDPDKYFRFEYNATSTSKTIFLETNYVKIDGKPVGPSMTLEPFSSIVLIKKSLE